MSQWIRAVAPILTLAALASPVRAQQGFEGVVTWNLPEGKEGKAMTQMYKGSKVRTEMAGEGGATGVMIMDGATRTMTMIMASHKMYMTMDLKKMGEHMAGGAHDDDTPPKITDTGKTETIAGHTCQVYRYAEEAGKPETMELCAAKGMGFFMMGSGGPMDGRGPMAGLSAAAANPTYAKMYKDGFFPLRVSKLEGGKVTNVLVAQSIEQKSVDASVFEVPAGYTEMKMPAGMPQRP